MTSFQDFSWVGKPYIVMLFKPLFLLYILAAFSTAKECKPGQGCELRCCTVSVDEVQCRERCLGLSCELDVHCDGDCCVNSTCTSCLLKRLFPTTSKGPSTVSLEATNEPKFATEMTAMTAEDNFKMTGSASKRHHDATPHGCSRFNNQCPSGCCIDGQCVDSSQCEPVKAPRGGKGGGGRGGGFRGGGGGYSGNGSANGGGSTKPWVIAVIIIASILMFIVPLGICICWFRCCSARE